MRRFLPILFLTLSHTAAGQSLYLADGENGVEVSAGWSVGPFSKGLETFIGAGINGRFDVGLGISRYTYTLDEGVESEFTEYAPFLRYFPVKQEGSTPVSLSLNAQVFLDDYGTDDEGRYVQLGTTVYKLFDLTDRFVLLPFVGFAFVAEEYTFGDAPTDRAQYLTRDLGVHFSTQIDRPWLLRLTIIEQSFRRETYRGIRGSILRRL